VQPALKTAVSPVSDAPHHQAVAFYFAIIGSTVEHSAFGMNAALDRSKLIAALESPQRRVPTPSPRPHADSQDDLTLRALARLKAFFDCAGQLPRATADDILCARLTRFPLTEPTPAAPPPEYERFRVRAWILTNGDPKWSYEVSSGDYPTGLKSEMQESDRGLFIQSLVKADLESRIARKRFVVANRP